MRNSTTYKLTGTKTFRLSSSKILGRWGSNLQNIEKSMREIYYPDDGKIFVQTDQAGAEALIVSRLTRAGNYRALFDNGIKPHTYICCHIFEGNIWPRKMKEHGFILDEKELDMEQIKSCPIPELKTTPLWKSLDSCIRSSDNWSITERYYYLGKQTEHCVDKETMLLTQRGWVSASVYNGTESIAVYDNGVIRFEQPTAWNVFNYEGDMIQFLGDEVNQLVTPNHKILYESNGEQHSGRAINVFRNKRLSIPTSGNYIGGLTHLEDWRVKLLVAIQADAHWCKSEAYGSNEMLPKVIFRLKRQRKIKRLLEILHEGNCRYNLASHAHGVTCITVFDLEDTVKYFGDIKQFDSWIFTLSKSNLELIVSELHHWDGTKDISALHKREAYYSAVNRNAHYVKLLCHFVGKQGTLNYNSNSQVFCVGINSRKNSIADCNTRVKNYSGKVYCPTVSSGYFLINREGKISITGNSSNYDIQPPTFRMNILDKSGGKILISKADSERFIATKHRLFPEIKEDFHATVQRSILRDKILYNLLGHPYQITQPYITERDFKEYYAWIPQSTVGEITNVAYANMQNYSEICCYSGVSVPKVLNEQVTKALDIYGSAYFENDLLANTHDSLMSQCLIDEVLRCGKLQKFFIEQTMTSPFDGTIFAMKSETSAGFNWRPFKVEKNPLGLKEIKV